ncbi:MAG: NAD(P)-dependent alcohol dehydrogenase [Thermoanaerobaculaceae bacterium]|nr:NAD(P)-dependent alcohol dehydrogenase [Thermoanaerobaculaceae bacterium]
MAFRGYVVRTAKAALEPFEFEPKPLGPEEVEIAISHCGICHSDVHLADGDWGNVFPLVPGHEVIGTVVAGEGFAPGQRVGVGWQRSSCGTCEYCRGGEEELCPKSEATCAGNFGGFADRIRVNRRFAIPIPEGLDSAAAAPLLCGGITVYSPLRRYASAGSRVAVIGIGGLGHLALQFARAMGCEVTAVSRSAAKEADAKRFGAHHFLTSKPRPGSFDLILNTGHFSPAMDVYLAALRPKGVFCQLGAAAEPLLVPGMPLITGRRSVCGSAIGAPGVIREMLEVAARHGIQATVEVVPMSEAQAAMEKTRRNQAHYRMVLAGDSGK